MVTSLWLEEHTYPWNRTESQLQWKQSVIGDFHGDCFMIDLTKEVFFWRAIVWENGGPKQNPRDTPRNETESPLKPAQIQVTLPSGYLCTVVGNGTADPLGEKAFFKHLGKNWREIAGIISYRLNSGTPLNFTRLHSWWELGNSPWVWQHCAGALRQDLNNDGWNDNPMSTIFSGSWSSEP